MVGHLKKGDLVYCQIINYKDIEQDKFRPCLVLEVLDKGIKVLPVTNTYGTNKVDVSFISCCQAIGGFISITPEETALSYCKLNNISNCDITWQMRLILVRYNIKY